MTSMVLCAERRCRNFLDFKMVRLPKYYLPQVWIMTTVQSVGVRKFLDSRRIGCLGKR